MHSSKESGTKELLKPQIRAVIFDLDGLLIDSEPIWDQAYYNMLEKKGLKDQIVKDTSGMGLKEFIEIWKKYGLVGDTDELLKEYRKTFYEILMEKDIPVMDGVNELLIKLEGHYQLAVATGGHTKEKCSQILKNLRIDGYFDVVVSSDDVKEGKPAPDVYIYTAEKLGVESAKCLVLEDSINGVLSARAAQAEVFGVNPDEKTREQLDKAGADRVFKSLSEVQIP